MTNPFARAGRILLVAIEPTSTAPLPYEAGVRESGAAASFIAGAHGLIGPSEMLFEGEASDMRGSLRSTGSSVPTVMPSIGAWGGMPMRVSAGQLPTSECPVARRQDGIAYRKMFRDPGIRRLVRLGDFRRLLVPQLAHPERLRESHLLACHVQVLEATRAQSAASLAEAIAKDGSKTPELTAFDDAAARALRLPPLDPPRRRARNGEPGVLLPGDRVFFLKLAEDPTQAQAPPATAGAPHARSAAQAPRSKLRTSVPRVFTRPWEFRQSREEALYDMNVESMNTGPFRRLVQRVGRWLGGHRRIQRWQVLIAGKHLEEQLWSVRPPEGGLAHPKVRNWACRTLAAAGYDPRAMLTEWEIFWRRKGL